MKKSNVPDIKIELTPFDRIVEFCSIGALAVLLALPAFYFGRLPDEIPIHFNAAGDPDSFSGKGFVWLLPLVGAVLFAVLTLASKNTKDINYPGKITEENAERVYTNSFRMVRVLKLIILLAFIWITWSTIQTALGMANGLGTFFLPVFLLAVFGPIVFFYLKSTGKIS